MAKKTQEQELMARLKKGEGVTPITALFTFDCFRLAAVVKKLRNKGINIRTEIIKNGGSGYARYWLIRRPSRLDSERGVERMDRNAKAEEKTANQGGQNKKPAGPRQAQATR
jgi:hypothetical protein